ncbi:MAG: lycopene beta-cyclase CrtY [Kofleriaceae bacterium]|nr:lycopene beta-cyclase CrtY [Kofleriaceae bacterium]MCL4228698.1 lycopene beta-cyclase CrtY [Myxococcales bacterium]
MSKEPLATPLDLALVGGGLQNGLVALATLAARPDARIAIFERGPALGGNHTWCFHDGDLPDDARPWLEPLVARRWAGYEVRFAPYRRALASGYACITSARFDEVVRATLAAAPHARVHTGVDVVAIAPGKVTVRAGGDGAPLHTVAATTVVDARGPGKAAVTGGWQKFVGQELELEAPHGLTDPVLMDATVPQVDGFRFVYVLPLGPDRLLVEDTCFSEDPALDAPRLRQQLAAYVAAQGWRVRTQLREEDGVLPLPWQTEVVPPRPGLVTAGYQGGWFHPVTGYSFPVALRVATTIAHAVARGDDPAAAVAATVPAHQAQLRFALRLVWMMFRWFPPASRAGVLEHFYRLPEDTVRRFYALALTGRDQARMFLGRPPRGLSWRAMVRAGGGPDGISARTIAARASEAAS